MFKLSYSTSSLRRSMALQFSNGSLRPDPLRMGFNQMKSMQYGVLVLWYFVQMCVVTSVTARHDLNRLQGFWTFISVVVFPPDGLLMS
jgi:hypothetical protein